METIARFIPSNFKTYELEIIANTFDEVFYVGEDQYKRVEKIEFGDIGVRPYKCYRNDEEIAEWEYENALGTIHTIERNHLAFLQSGKVCDLYFYHMHDGSLRNVVEVEFFSEAERENFIRPFWFGKEIKGKHYDAFSIWNAVII